MGRQNILLSAGSNSAGQLGIGHLDDSHIWQTCQCVNGETFPPKGWQINQLSSGAGHTVALLQREDTDPQVWI